MLLWINVVIGRFCSKFVTLFCRRALVRGVISPCATCSARFHCFPWRGGSWLDSFPSFVWRPGPHTGLWSPCPGVSRCRKSHHWFSPLNLHLWNSPRITVKICCLKQLINYSENLVPGIVWDRCLKQLKNYGKNSSQNTVKILYRITVKIWNNQRITVKIYCLKQSKNYSENLVSETVQEIQWKSCV